ncbi:MAG TPA: SusC/RagA family TonB-linked outer membrane protein [Gemmatimonadaceae bacterium]|nr:SusC/RagA family TonB-linked outer membrane protein [Gemmatimonadaceae bacterium]
MKRTLRRILVAAAALTTPVVAVGAQATGIITGRVTDRSTQQPISDAQVLVVGTTRGARTTDAGQYRLPGVPAGQVRIRVIRLGYEAEARTLTVGANETVTADFALGGTATRLDQVVVSATGESELRRESGNNIATINTDSIPKTVINGVSDLLSSRAANVVVTQTSGTTGGGSRIRIRGSNSLSLSNEPLIIIDGVRAISDVSGSTIDIGGQNPSRLDDLNPEDIEDIEIIKGPAAAALYGTAAANGVVQITTKRGRSGKTKWTAYADGGSVRDVTAFPANFGAVGLTPANRRTTGCSLDLEALGACTQKADSLLSFNPLESHGPFVDGWRTNYGASAAGGTEMLQYYLAGDFGREQGVYPNNEVRRRGFRANLTGSLSPKLDVGVRAGYNQTRLKLPQNDNNDLSPIANGIFGSAEDDPDLHGYLFYPVEVMNAIYTAQDVDRTTLAGNGNWRPLPWLSVVGVSGLDYAGRTDLQVIQPGLIPDPDRRASGNATSNPYSFWTYTANVNGTASYNLSGLAASTSLGAQYNKEAVNGTQAAGEGLVAGSSSVAGTTTGFAATAQNSDIITLGAYVQQKLAWRDRLFLTAAIRGDDNSAFGQDFKLVAYPSASLSWVVGDESWFPKIPSVSSLRLRGSFGRSGQRPGFRNAVSFYQAVGVRRESGDIGGVELGANIGNNELKPELSTEYEGGLDVGLLNSRLSLELTYYNKATRDALIQRQLAPSTGAQTQFENLGEVTNKGVEGTLNASVLDLANFKWNVTLNASLNSNRLVTLGVGVDTIFLGLGAVDGNAIQRFVEGRPTAGYWQRPLLSWQDKNNDGIISPVGCGPTSADDTADCEITIGDNVAYLGNPLPKREVTLNTNFTLFKYFRVAGVVDHRGGYKLYNATEQFRCVIFVTCQAAYDRRTSLEDQAARIASTLGTDAGYVEDASFVKLRELSLTLLAPNDWARRVGTQSLSLTLAGRNLATWTGYKGFDPELNWNGTSNYSTADFLTQPPVRYFTARLSLNW